MLAVTFEDDLDISRLHGVHQNVREPGLHSGMEMDLRLLEEDRGTFRRVVAQGDHGQDLRDTEADVGDQDLRRLRVAPHPHLEQASAFGDRAHLERGDQPELLQPFGDALLDSLPFLSFPARDLDAELARRQQRIHHPLSPLSDVHGLRTGPDVLALGILPERTQVEKAAEELFELQLEIREEACILVIGTGLVREAVTLYRWRQLPGTPLRTDEIEALIGGGDEELVFRPLSSLLAHAELLTGKPILHLLHPPPAEPGLAVGLPLDGR